MAERAAGRVAAGSNSFEDQPLRKRETGADPGKLLKVTAQRNAHQRKRWRTFTNQGCQRRGVIRREGGPSASPGVEHRCRDRNRSVSGGGELCRCQITEPPKPRNTRKSIDADEP